MDTLGTVLCIRNATFRIRVPELVIGARRTESLIGNGIPDGYLDINMATKFFYPAYLFYPRVRHIKTAKIARFKKIDSSLHGPNSENQCCKNCSPNNACCTYQTLYW